MIRRLSKSLKVRRPLVNNEGLQRGRVARSLQRDEKGMSMGGRQLLEEFDDICRKYSDREAETVRDLGQILSGIESDASKLGLSVMMQVFDGVNGSPHYRKVSIDDFMRKVVSPDWFDGQNISVDFVDGEPGDSYMLCFHGEDPDDMEECASFVVADARSSYERRNVVRRNIVRGRR